MRTRNAETPKSGAGKKTPTPKKDAASAASAATEKTPEAATPKSATKSTPGAKGPKKATPKSTPPVTAPDPKPEPKAEEMAAPAEEKKPASAVKSPEKKAGVKGKSPVAGKASVAPKTEEAKVEAPAVKAEEEHKEEVPVVEVASDVKDESESEPVNTEAVAAVEEEEVEEEEPMEEDAEQEGYEEGGDEEGGEEGGEGDEVVVEEEQGAEVEEEEQFEISDMAKARKIKKEQEIFVGGLDRDAVEEDLKKVFEKVGEVVEVRLHKDFATNKNKGFAFVKFANKEQAAKAIAELKNPVIRGKRCGIAPSEDNDTLFVGNICNTWTREAIKRKLKDYGIDNVESITLVADTQNEGLSRGFAFMEFPCHADAMVAYKRLQKPDAIFGHPERTAKVAFAEPLREPDPEVMAQVKSVFVDGLPPHWDEDRVKDHFKGYGEIERVVLARNMSTAKRKDFGFVNFTTHEAAVTCVEGVNNTDLGDGKSKLKARARLANPLPKTQAVKGGMSGGFRIGHSGLGVYSRFGRGFSRGRFFSGRVGFQRGRGFNLRGRGRGGRFPYATDNVESTYSEFRGRRPFGARGGRVFTSARGGAFVRGRGKAFLPRRQPFAQEEGYSGPFNARHLAEDPYAYGDGGHGIKRPYSMMEHDAGYLEPGSRLRARYDHPDSMPGRYRGSLGTTGTGLYSHDYYGPDYGGSTYSSLYGGEQSGRGYYY